jgi:SAM-dependent methyltransferase
VAGSSFFSYARNLISKEEKRILKQLSIRGDSTLLSVDLTSGDFLSQLIDLASSIAITQASTTFHSYLYRHCTTNQAKSLSKAERKEKAITDNSFVYGEIDFHSFASIIKEIRPLFKPDGVFVDLGSGTGRACFAMALLSDMKKIIGIEALQGLSDASRQILELYETFIEDDAVEIEVEDPEEDATTAANGGSPSRTTKKKKILHSPLAKLERRASLGQAADFQQRVQMITGDFLKVDWWTETDFLFLNSTCYSPTLIAEISKLAEKMKPGSIIVSLTKALVGSSFTVVSKKKHQMSWGSASVYTQRKQ